MTFSLPGLPGAPASRKADIEKLVRETLTLIRQYEEVRILSDDPKGKLRSEREISRLRSLLKEYQAELEALSARVSEYKLSDIRDLLVSRFSLDEIQLLCFDLGIDYTHLAGTTHQAKAQSLVAYSHRTGRLDKLVSALKRARPDVYIRPADTEIAAPETSSIYDAVTLRQFISEHFSLEEVRTLAQDLGVDYDTLPGEGLTHKARELTDAFARRGRLTELAVLLRQYRPVAFDTTFFPKQRKDSEVSLRVAEQTEQVLVLLSRSLQMPLLERSASVRDFRAFMLDASAVLQDTNLPSALPIVFCSRTQLDDLDLQDIRILVNQMMEYPHRRILLFTLHEAADLEHIKRTSAQSMRHTYAYDVVFLNMSLLRGIIGVKDPRREFRKIILSHLDLLTLSPYTVNGPVPDNVFFGRENVIRQIVEKATATSFAVVGGRKIGKSSLLGRLHRVRLPAANFVSIYHDCSTTPTLEQFMSARVLDWRPAPPSGIGETLGDMLSLSRFERPVVLLLDEADKLLPFDRVKGWPLLNTLRARLGSGGVQTVLCGERALRDALRDPTSPLFNLANEMVLGPLEHRAVHELVTRPMRQLEIRLVNETGIVQRIYGFTSGHPNIVQRLCHRLIQKVNLGPSRQISEDDVCSIIEDPRFQEEDFLSTYWERATPLEQMISLLMAHDAKPYRLQTILDMLADYSVRPEPEVAKAALDRLVDLRTILKRSQIGYEFAVTAFPRVIANTTTAEDLLIVLRSQYLKNPMELPE